MNNLKKTCQCKELKNEITFQAFFYIVKRKKKEKTKGHSYFPTLALCIMGQVLPSPLEPQGPWCKAVLCLPALAEVSRAHTGRDALSWVETSLR